LKVRKFAIPDPIKGRLHSGWRDGWLEGGELSSEGHRGQDSGKIPRTGGMGTGHTALARWLLEAS